MINLVLSVRNNLQRSIATRRDQEGFNRWVAGEKLGHDPTDRECMQWFIDHGAAEFQKRFDLIGFAPLYPDRLALPAPSQN